MKNRKAAELTDPPPATLGRRFQGWYAFAEKPNLQARRMGIVAVFALVLAGIEGVALIQLMPLKERVPYFVEVEAGTGQVSASAKTAAKFDPGEANIRFFLNKWVTNAFTIDPARTKELLLPEAYAFTRGAARDQLRTWIGLTDKTLERMADNNQLRRDVKIASISFIAPGVVMVRAVFSERTGGSNTLIERRKAITINFGLLPTEKDEDILWNPIGLYINHFVINDELA